jgi:hypothetical protein
MRKSKESHYPGETLLRIISVYGSDGMPSCGKTDANRLGQNGDGDNDHVGGTSEEVKPGTPFWMLPFALLHKFLPDRPSKSLRNMQKWETKHGHSPR